MRRDFFGEANIAMRSKLISFLTQVFVAVCIIPLPFFTASAAIVPDAPSVGARAYILQDFDSGRVLAEVNADERMEPASLTKIMTAYVVFEELEQGKIAMEDQVLVSEKAWRMGGSKMFIEVDTKVSVEDLLKGLIIQSGNDASVALAEFIAGDEDAFADLMNQYAVRLGMTGTHFINASGLPHPEHYTTARDTATLAAAMIRDFPELYKIHAVKEYEYNGIVQHNRNKLLWRDESVDGLKTGHTESAGYCLVASAERDGMRLISVVMGSESERSRARESIALLSYGFRFFETHRLYGALEPLTEIRIWKGEIEKARNRSRPRPVRHRAQRPVQEAEREDGNRQQSGGPGNEGRGPRKAGGDSRRRANRSAASGDAGSGGRRRALAQGHGSGEDAFSLSAFLGSKGLVFRTSIQ